MEWPFRFFTNLEQGILTVLLETSGTLKSTEVVPGTAAPNPQAPSPGRVTLPFEWV